MLLKEGMGPKEVFEGVNKLHADVQEFMRAGRPMDQERMEKFSDELKKLLEGETRRDEQLKAALRNLGTHVEDATEIRGMFAPFEKVKITADEDFAGGSVGYQKSMMLTPEELASGLPRFVRAAFGRTAKDLDRAEETAYGAKRLHLVRELQQLNDELFFYDLIRCGNGHTQYAQQSASKAQRLRRHPQWGRWEKLAGEFQRALDTLTSNEGLQWIPTILSTRMIDLIEPELRVASLFNRVTMPNKNLDLPVLGGNSVAFLVLENSVDTITGGGTSIPRSDPVTSKVSLVAKKLATSIISSTELDEDSVVAASQFLPFMVAKVIGRGIEDALINGDTAGTHQDNDVSTATDRRKIWDGLRKKALIANMPNVDLSTFSSANLLTIKSGMGVYGSVPSMGAWIVGYKGLIKLLGLPETITLEKFGPNAAVLTGQMANYFGSPVILSEFTRENVASTGVNTMAGPNTFTTLLYANREAFTIGDRRQLTVRTSMERLIEFDQAFFVGTWRGDFTEYYTTVAAANKIVGIGRNFS